MSVSPKTLCFYFFLLQPSCAPPDMYVSSFTVSSLGSVLCQNLYPNFLEPLLLTCPSAHWSFLSPCLLCGSAELSVEFSVSLVLFCSSEASTWLLLTSSLWLSNIFSSSAHSFYLVFRCWEAHSGSDLWLSWGLFGFRSWVLTLWSYLYTHLVVVLFLFVCCVWKRCRNYGRLHPP